MSRKTSEGGKNLIKEFEGFRATAYICPAGVVTVGYGTTRIQSKSVQLGTTITTDEADMLLEEDLKTFEDAINQNVRGEISQNQFDALVAFVYNVGAGNFKKSTLLKKINAGDFNQAADEFLKWNKAGGKVLKGLTRRRTAERELFLRD
jgi:lysozyme